jgi:NADH-quinone oxidoreductase subunit H
MLYTAVIFFIKILIIVVPLLISVAFFTLAERKILGSIQRRRGPNVIGVFGLLQPFSDGLKLLIKETVVPSSSNKYLFLISPIITFFISLMGWSVIPYGPFSILSDMDLGFLFILAISSLGVYGIIISGWSSNSKYAFLGALRSTAQMVSYEISIGFILVTVVITCGSFNPQVIIKSQYFCWNIITFFPLFLMFFISSLAETNRHPFDLPEAEAELVSGYNVEYSAMGFALFSLGEYSNMLLMSSINTIIFLGGWLSPFDLLNCSFCLNLWFGIKMCVFVVFFVWIRAALPRYRYDQLMNLGWKCFLPISLIYFSFTVFILISFNSLPF